VSARSTFGGKGKKTAYLSEQAVLVFGFDSFHLPETFSGIPVYKQH
jgi:hypothetical protein